jgi:nitrous oxidase accessory protein
VSSVAAGVAAAAPGDTVIVESGTYREHGVTVDIPIVLMGLGRPVLDAGHQGEILTISSDGVTVSGFVLQNVGTSFMEDRAAVRLAGVQHCVVEDNTVLDAFFAVYAENTGNSVIRRNTIRGRAERESTSGNGIHLWYCRGVTVEGNDVSGHRDGIYFEFVEDSRVVGNTSHGNLRYGLHFMFSHRDDYEDNAFIDNGAGVAVMYSGHVTITNNRFEHNWGAASYGLLLKEIKDSRVERNLFSRNTVALYSEGSNRVTVIGNEFIDNGFAVKVMANSMANVFEGNNFIGNTFDVTTNSRQNFNTFTGNYWGEYRGYDLDRDGVGDVPHHPVRLFALLVEKQPPGIILMNSLFVRMIDTAERALPAFTPETLVDGAPLIRPATPGAAAVSVQSTKERKRSQP